MRTSQYGCYVHRLQVESVGLCAIVDIIQQVEDTLLLHTSDRGHMLKRLINLMSIATGVSARDRFE